jgi:prepilin-type N-terminal cleavage/methylation domain-containing protein
MRTARGRRRSDDAGLSLVEVVVAMTVFAVIAMGLLTSVTKSLAMIRDNRARVVAANLAESEISLVRATPYDQIATAQRTQTVGTLTYTINRSVKVKLDTGGGDACSGGAVVQDAYKMVGVTVSFTKAAAVRDVKADTIVRAPDTVVSTTTGAIGASVIDRDGHPVSGVLITAGAATALTDDSGCVYLQGIAPGNLTVSAARTGYLGQNEQPTQSQTVGVTAGVISAPQFLLDDAATVSVRVAALAADASELSGYTFPQLGTAGGVQPLLDNPSRTPVTRVTLTGATVSTASTWTVPAFPYSNGYEAHLGACGPGTSVTTGQGATVAATLGLAPVDVQLAPLPPKVSATLVGRTVAAVLTSGVCTETYTSVATTAADGTLHLALPYGSWVLSVSGDNGGYTLPVTLASGSGPTAVTLLAKQ